MCTFVYRHWPDQEVLTVMSDQCLHLCRDVDLTRSVHLECVHLCTTPSWPGDHYPEGWWECTSVYRHWPDQEAFLLMTGESVHLYTTIWQGNFHYDVRWVCTYVHRHWPDQEVLHLMASGSVQPVHGHVASSILQQLIHLESATVFVEIR